MYDDGSGTIVEIFHIVDFEKLPVPKGTIRIINISKRLEKWGQFFSAESYIILYKYMVKNKEEFIIYFWQGRNSSINEKGTSAYLTVDLDQNEVGGAATQIRVVQNKEPKHFFSIFKGRVIVHYGKPGMQI
jgi:hypothetical protein